MTISNFIIDCSNVLESNVSKNGENMLDFTTELLDFYVTGDTWKPSLIINSNRRTVVQRQRWQYYQESKLHLLLVIYCLSWVALFFCLFFLLLFFLFFYVNIYKKTKLLYNLKNKQKEKIKNIKQTKLHPTFTSVKYACGGMPNIESMYSYQTISKSQV